MREKLFVGFTNWNIAQIIFDSFSLRITTATRGRVQLIIYLFKTYKNNKRNILRYIQYVVLRCHVFRGNHKFPLSSLNIWYENVSINHTSFEQHESIPNFALFSTREALVFEYRMRWPRK